VKARLCYNQRFLPQFPARATRVKPIHVRGGKWEIVQGIPINDFSRAKIDASVAELKEDRSLVGDLLG
jgi:malate dehydrogenase